MHRYHAYLCVLRSCCLVSSHNALYSQFESERVADVAKTDYPYWRSSDREEINIIRLQLAASKI